MAERQNTMLNKTKPWRSDARWEIVAVEAILLVALGLYTLIATESAGNAILQIVGLVLLIVSAQVAISSFRFPESGLGAYDTFRAGIGVTVGLIATSLWWAEAVPNSAVRFILGWGLVGYTVIHLVGLIMVRGRENLRPMSIVLSLFALVLGILLLTTNDATAESTLNFLGAVFLVFGVLLGGLAYLIRSRDTQTA